MGEIMGYFYDWKFLVMKLISIYQSLFYSSMKNQLFFNEGIFYQKEYHICFFDANFIHHKVVILLGLYVE